LGFYGFANLYKYKELDIPSKKSKNQQLSEKQKEENKAISSQRVKVEHSIAGLKRYRILSDRLRIRDYKFYDQVLGVCAGLWNLMISD